MSRQSLGWYVRRLQRMRPQEVFWRTRDLALHVGWSARPLHAGRSRSRPPAVADPRFTATLPANAADRVPTDVAKTVVTAADELLAGRLYVLGVWRLDLRQPDWFLDPITGRRSDPTRHSYTINQRSVDEVGNVKQVWELSRHQYLTQLAAAYYLTGDDTYAERVHDHLTSWWQANPFLRGVHWTSGIEVGIRLLSWVWIRRLLDGWPRVTELFELNDAALQQLYWHQRYLAAFRSRGTSANNHVIAEAAGLLAASCAFPWFSASAGWRADATSLLQRELANNTFADGLNRELATEYHRLVTELGVLAAVEADAAGAPVDAETWTRLTAMFDTAAAVVDETCRAPRQGDGDDGRALLLEPRAESDDWSALLTLGSAVVGALPWWPCSRPDLVSDLVCSLTARPPVAAARRPVRRADHFADAGLTLLRTNDPERAEIWCRCDGGPHGFLGIAAHAHADALSIELRVGGIDVLADPGTYCYHDQPRWRSYFRSTIAHNTVELGWRDQSIAGGPFLWSQPVDGSSLDVAVGSHASRVRWCAEHTGYWTLSTGTGHRRTVVLDRERRVLEVGDHFDVDGSPPAIRMAYHLGPAVDVSLRGSTATLSWTAVDGGGNGATVELPERLSWSLHRGETEPILGWYSPSFGERVPTYTLLGTSLRLPADPLRTVVRVYGDVR
ncbi:MAG: heparinase [Streptosporangiales bacterium]|nr:heparinase [Streptosporangiales bacterium]